jgi:hypothetical protein
VNLDTGIFLYSFSGTVGLFYFFTVTNSTKQLLGSGYEVRLENESEVEI